MSSLLRFGPLRNSVSFGLFSIAVSASALELHKARSSPFDLAIKGRIEGFAPGEVGYLSWNELRTLPSSRLRVDGEFVPGEQEVTIVLLEDLVSRLSKIQGADTVISTCTDGYAAVYTPDYRARYKPFVVLEINGEGPEKWPPKGMTFNPGPYVISIADQLAPGASTLLDASHKRPWGVDCLEIVDYPERFARFYQGALASASTSVAEGRDIWVNSCFSCHNVPEAELGGTKAGRPMQIVMMQAVYNSAYFKGYVRDPSKLNPNAKMQAHPHYSEAQLEGLIGFLKLLSAQ